MPDQAPVRRAELGGTTIACKCDNEDGVVLAQGHPQVGQLGGENTAHVFSSLQRLVPIAARRCWQAG